uniref:Uncharacterized protein n=1 Tax=Sphaerodactylus townsendi TaxID=933632 RepID=A0ACB8GA73_9SAUR
MHHSASDFGKAKAFMAELRVVSFLGMNLICPVTRPLVSFSQVTVPSIALRCSVQVFPCQLLHGSRFKSYQMLVVTTWSTLFHSTSPCSSVDFSLCRHKQKIEKYKGVVTT